MQAVFRDPLHVKAGHCGGVTIDSLAQLLECTARGNIPATIVFSDLQCSVQNQVPETLGFTS
jgi:hypothetical protein